MGMSCCWYRITVECECCEFVDNVCVLFFFYRDGKFLGGASVFYFGEKRWAAVFKSLYVDGKSGKKTAEESVFAAMVFKIVGETVIGEIFRDDERIWAIRVGKNWS